MATLRKFRPFCGELFRFSLLSLCILSLGCKVMNSTTATPPSTPPPSTAPSTPPPTTPPPSTPPPTTPPPSTPPAVATTQLTGTLHEGQQAIAGAAIELYAAGTTGYGKGAVSLLSTPGLTDANGNFTVTTTSPCPASTSQLYVVATGGSINPSASTNNAGLALMGAIGPCMLNSTVGTSTSLPAINIDEATTLAAVYSLAGFMDPVTSQIGASASNTIGIANAFQTASNLVDITTGQPLATIPSGNAAVPNAEIDTLADIIAPCVQSTSSTADCTALFAAATPASGTTPGNTIQALFNIATHPVSQVSTLFALVQSSAPFQPTLSAAPNDWTVALHYTGGGIAGPGAVSLDSRGDVWLANGNDGIIELSSSGTFLSGPAGFTGGGINGPRGLAIDLSDNVWVANFFGNSVTELNSSGVFLSGATGFTNGISGVNGVNGVNGPTFVAIDGTGDAWVTHNSSTSSTITKLASDGTLIAGPLSPCPDASTCQLDDTFQIAIDGAEDVWLANNNPGPAAVAKLSNDGSVLSGQTGFTSGVAAAGFIAFDHAGDAWVTNYTSDGVSNIVTKLDSNGNVIGSVNAGRLFDASGIAIDGSGNAWVAGESATSAILTELSNDQDLLSGSTGYMDTAPLTSLTGCIPNPMTDCLIPRSSKAVAIDGSGNAWVANTDSSVSEFVGIATPVVTPLSVGAKNNTLGTRP